MYTNIAQHRYSNNIVKANKFRGVLDLGSQLVWRMVLLKPLRNKAGLTISQLKCAYQFFESNPDTLKLPVSCFRLSWLDFIGEMRQDFKLPTLV